MKKKKWLVFQLLQFALFAGVGLYLYLSADGGRQADIEKLSFGLWCAVYVCALAAEWGVFFLLKLLRRLRA